MMARNLITTALEGGYMTETPKLTNDMINEAFEREIRATTPLGASGSWVVCAKKEDHSQVAIYRDLDPPHRDDVEQVFFRLDHRGPHDPIIDPTLDEARGSKDFLQAALDCAWGMGLRPGPVIAELERKHQQRSEAMMAMMEASRLKGVTRVIAEAKAFLQEVREAPQTRAERLLTDVTSMLASFTEGWKEERADAVRELREICEDFGDNDWEDDLHLADVIGKHLGNALYEEKKAREMIEEVRSAPAVPPLSSRPIRQTHTYVTLEVPAEMHAYVREELLDAGYVNAVDDRTGELDMNGLALVAGPPSVVNELVEAKPSDVVIEPAPDGTARKPDGTLDWDAIKPVRQEPPTPRGLIVPEFKTAEDARKLGRDDPPPLELNVEGFRMTPNDPPSFSYLTPQELVDGKPSNPAPTPRDTLVDELRCFDLFSPGNANEAVALMLRAADRIEELEKAAAAAVAGWEKLKAAEGWKL
jgi:hypothetical protein